MRPAASISRRRARRNGERGAVAVMAAIVMSMVIGFLALAMNVGIMMESRGQLQNAADAAALAAARALNGQAGGITAARQAAIDYSAKHNVYGASVSIGSSDVTFGRWEFDSTKCSSGNCFFSVSETLPRQITAVKVTNGRDGVGSHNAVLSLPLGAFTGSTTTTVRSTAVAVGAGSEDVTCSLPLAVAECTIVNSLTNALNCGTNMALVLSNANDDTLGYANMTSSSNAPNDTWAAGQIDSGTCNDGTARVGQAKLQNGNDFGKVAAAIAGQDKGGSCLIGTTQTLAVTDAGCPGNPIFQNTQSVVGFVQVKIIGATDNHGTSQACPGQAAPNLGTAPKNSLVVHVSCSTGTAGSGEYGGGRAYNTGVTLRLVQ